MDFKLLVEVREKIIREYFSMWVSKDFDRLDEIFSSNCVFQESYGPCYLSLLEINRWIEKKLNEQSVLSWKIKEVWPSVNDKFFVVWNFTAIGKFIIQTLENDSYFKIATRVEIPASITTVGFYKKMGYFPKDKQTQPDSEGLFRLEKYTNG